MNVQCIICIGLVDQTSDIYSTPCGHIFHYGCLLQWLDKKKTCPQCRAPTNERRIQRLFFNFSNTDSDQVDPVSLQHVVDDLKFKLVLKNEEIKKETEKRTTLETQVTGLKKEVRKVEKEIAVANSTIHTLRDQAKYFKGQSAEADLLKREVLKLRDEVTKLKNVQVILAASADEVDSIISRTSDPAALGTYVSVIKREMTTMMSKTKEHRAQIRSLKMELSKVSMERNMLLDVRDKCKKLEEDLQVCESEKIILQNKLQELNGCMQKCKKPRHSASNVNRAERLHLDIDDKPKEENIKPVKSSNVEENGMSDPVINLDEGDNSPYLPVKSQGIFAIKRGHSLRSIAGQSNFGMSKKRTIMPCLNGLLEGTEQYDGFGSHSKYDHFPEPVLKAKRLKDNPSKAKKQKQLNEFLDLP